MATKLQNAFMLEQARLILSLEDQVQLNSNYKSLFDGLKLNSPHNSAVMFPLA